MSDSSHRPKSSSLRLAVIGGGISGLAAAHQLHQARPDATVNLLAAGDRLGGSLWTERIDAERAIEHGSDMFSSGDPWAYDLAKRIGFSDQLIETSRVHRRALVMRRGKLYPIPPGFALMSPARMWPVLTTRLLSPWGKLRLACEYFIPRRQDRADESLRSFAVRRFGREAFERLIQPLVAGMYTADPQRLSMQAALERFVRMEREYGSLIRAARSQPQQERAAGGARYNLFVAPQGGMSELVRAIAGRLPTDSIRLGSCVTRITASGRQWIVSDDRQELAYDGVVLALPAPRVAELLQPIAPTAAGLLQGIEYASAAVVNLIYSRDQIGRPPRAFGFVVPQQEDSPILAASFSNIKFPGRAPQTEEIVRVFLGGALAPDVLERDDADLIRLARQEIERLLGIRGQPTLTRLTRWNRAMPQYHVDHLQRVEQLEQQLVGLKRITLCGNAYHGIGIPFCVRSGEQAANSLLAQCVEGAEHAES